ncbi:MAG TPA: glycosyltransferase, partial [Patescibacteria group bacterium]|nr:glycosyltransferase [Patescibacteria group bacterium]
VEDLLGAIKIVKEQIPEVQCKIIGSGPRENKLKALARELGIDDRVEFLGFIPKRSDVIALMKRSHVFCLPSLVEGFGMVTIEALAAGIPYVNSDIPATREITEGGIGGLLFEPKNIGDLAEKMMLTLRAQNISETQRLQADRLIRAYEWKRLSAPLVDTYKRLV